MAAFILKHRKSIVIGFTLLAIISIFAQFTVSTNYNMVDYLPEEAPSTNAMGKMETEFEGSIPNTRVMMKDLSLTEALSFKASFFSFRTTAVTEG